jgi:hypothetical protein
LRFTIFIVIGILGLTFFKQIGEPIIAFAEIALLIESIVLFRWLSKRTHEPLQVWSAVLKGLVAALLGGITAYVLAVIVPGSAVLTALLGMVVGGLVALPFIWSEVKLLVKL